MSTLKAVMAILIVAAGGMIALRSISNASVSKNAATGLTKGFESLGSCCRRK